VDVAALFVSNPQATKLIQPREGPFHYPAPSSESTAMFRVAFCQERNDVSRPQFSPDRLGVIATISRCAIRAMPWATSFSLQLRDGIDQCERLPRIIAISSG